MRKNILYLAALAAVLMLLSDTRLSAQEEPEKKPEGRKEFRAGRERGRGGFPGRQRFEGKEDRRRPGGMFPILERLGVAVSANERYVYVVKGNTLYQFKADDLSLVKKAKLEEHARPGPPRGEAPPPPPPPPEKPKPEEGRGQPPGE